MNISLTSYEGIDPNDIQAQVEELYSHILASVDESLNSEPGAGSTNTSYNSNSYHNKNRKQNNNNNVTSSSYSAYGGGKISANKSDKKLRPVHSSSQSTAVTAIPAVKQQSLNLNYSEAAPQKKKNITNNNTNTIRNDKNVNCSTLDFCCQCEEVGNISSTTDSNTNNDSNPCSCSCHQSPLGEETLVMNNNNNNNNNNISLKKLIPPSTFGSGRKGMTEPIKKNSTPGPGSYFYNEEVEIIINNSNNSTRHKITNSNVSQQSIKVKGEKATTNVLDKEKVLRRQFTLLCQCYWKQFPELDIPINPAAHAINCPCQSIPGASLESSESSKTSRTNSSNSNSNNNDKKKLLYKKQQERSTRNVISTLSSPRLGTNYNRSKEKKGAIFGTSPRRTIFDEKETQEHQKQNQNQDNKKGGNKYNHQLQSENNNSPNGESQSGRGLQNQDRTTPSHHRKILNSSSVSPGPGAYNISSTFEKISVGNKKSRGISIGRAARRLHELTDAPGPGTYNTEVKGITENQIINKKKNYFLTTSPRRLQLVSTKDAETQPGPGEYRTESVTKNDARHKNAPAFSFGRAKLTSCGNSLFNISAVDKGEEIPGPGSYDIAPIIPENNSKQNMSKGPIITTARRDDNMWRGVSFQPDTIPGPGTYNIIETSKGPSYSLRPRFTERIEETPGPGQYIIPEEVTGPKWTLSSARQTLTNVQETSPGPGDYFVPIYDLRRAHSTAPVFTTAPRLLHEISDQHSEIPGPGAYDTIDNNNNNNTISTSTKGAIIGTSQRILKNDNLENNVPGPGSYIVQYSAQEKRVIAPSFATTSPRFDETTTKDASVGPGYYDIDNKINLLNQRSAIVGTAPRELPFDNSSKLDTNAGPGTYDINIPKDGPSYSIRQRLTDHSEIENLTPGPGFYDPQNLISSPNIVLGSASRFQPSIEEKSKNEIPGPGAYTTSTNINGVTSAVIFGTSPRLMYPEELNNNNNNQGSGLGPGSYDPQKIKTNMSGAAWSNGPRFTQDEYNEIPGPGAYEVELHSPIRGLTFGTAGENSNWLIPTDSEFLPGPGSYIPQNPKEKKGPSVVFGSSPQHNLLPEEREALMRSTIGPGSYDVTLPIPHKFHATFGDSKSERIEDKKSEFIPGPGHYNPADMNISSSRTVVFGTSSRIPQENENNDIPGPGAYASESVKVINGGESSPGPVTFPNAPRFNNIEVNGTTSINNNTPGPGSYTIDGQGGRIIGNGGSSTVVFGTEPRLFNIEERERALFPGPGQYQINNSITMSNTPAYGFGKEPRILENNNMNEIKDVPGPGTYDVIIPTLTAPTIKFGTETRKMGPLILAEVPGPGAYDIISTTQSGIGISNGPAYHFPIASRELNINSSETPGPGQYDSNNAENYLWNRTGAQSFTTGPRFSNTKEEEGVIPGPGQYIPQNPKWETSQVYSFPSGTREISKNENELPGPGTYSPNLILNSSFAPVFGTEQRCTTNLISNNPGPGYYNPRLPSDGPAIKINTTERGITFDENGENLPGPGTYDINIRTDDGPVFSMHRTAPRGPTLAEVEKLQELPGPGTYTIPPAFPAKDGAGTSVSFVKAERFQSPIKEEEYQNTPGPGFYNPHLPNSTISTFIGSAPRLAELNNSTFNTEIPGPGHYEISRGDPIVNKNIDGSVALRFTSTRFSNNEDNAMASETPGPASYNPVDPRSLTPGGVNNNMNKAISFPQASRFNLAEYHNSASQPGPGEYSIPSTWQPSGANIGYSFGTSIRPGPANNYNNNNTQSDIPGPGSYDATRYAERFMSGPAFTLQGKSLYNLEESHAAQIPGPGTYCPRPIETIRTTNFGVASSINPDAIFEAHVNATPGPTTYNIPETLDKRGIKIGTAERDVQQQQQQKEDIPGPGAYLTGGPIVLQNTSGFTFGNASRPDVVSNSIQNFPGPGEYHHPINRKPFAPVFSFAGAERFNEAEAQFNNIGPGQYYHQESNEIQANSAYTFPTALRESNVKDNNKIGPGEYFYPQHWDLTGRGPTFPTTMGHYPPTLGANTPGPGAYHAEEYTNPGATNNKNINTNRKITTG